MALSIAFATGCSSTPETGSVKEPTKEQKERYTRVTPTGTWISKKVKKTEASASEQETAAAQQALSEIQRRGNRPVRDTGAP